MRWRCMVVCRLASTVGRPALDCSWRGCAEVLAPLPLPTAQALLAILDSPLNKAGRLKALYVHTGKNVLIQVNPQVRGVDCL